ncbi:MAG TPA: iron-sulfur cluster assembly protein [Candidatus Binatia bacterium]
MGAVIPTKEEIYQVLQQCYDPEIPVNIVDLGLIYDVQIDGGKVAVKMTLTAPGCGMGGMIAGQARQKILDNVDGVEEATVDIVWDPPWDPSRISEEAKHKLGIG